MPTTSQQRGLSAEGIAGSGKNLSHPALENSSSPVATQGGRCHPLTGERCHIHIWWHDTGLLGIHSRHSSRTVRVRGSRPADAPTISK
jgi:hypothetical protein